MAQVLTTHTCVIKVDQSGKIISAIMDRTVGYDQAADDLRTGCPTIPSGVPTIGL